MMMPLVRKAYNWLRHKVTRSQNTSPTSQAGSRAEQAAVAHLRRKGYRVLERNFTTRLGEIDIIAFRKGLVAFVEVRSLDENSPLDPCQTVTAAKRRRIIRAAHQYRRSRHLLRTPAAMRFDFIGVRLRQGQPVDLRHVENAFTVQEKSF